MPSFAPSIQPRHWGTIQEAAQRRDVSVSTMRRWIKSGVVYAERVGDRIVRVDLGSLESIGKPISAGGAR